jgi:hypothetical protein
MTSSYRTRLVLTADGERWVREYDLPIPPSPGLGLRLDVYEVLNVEAVTVGATGGFIESTVADEDGGTPTEDWLWSHGFRREVDSTPPDLPRAGGRDVVEAALVLPAWYLPLALPFPPFVGLRIRLESGPEFRVFTLVVGDVHGPVTCLATFADGSEERPDKEMIALGFEASVYP